jgi:HAD superfamily hydrolase (TIGR01484 family)
MAEKRKISLVLADVDGTLVNEEKVLTTRAQNAVGALRKAGIRFAITSGRPPLGMAMLFDPLELDTPSAGFNGGLFVKRDLTILEEKALPADVARQAIDLIREHGLDAWLYAGNDWLITKSGAPHAARGVDGPVRTQDRKGFRQLVAASGRQDRRRQRRSRPGSALRS